MTCKYDPIVDGCLRCVCRSGTNDVEYDDWPDVFRGLVGRELELLNEFPDNVVKNAAGQVATAIAVLSTNNSSQSQLTPEVVIDELAVMLGEMVEDAMALIEQDALDYAQAANDDFRYMMPDDWCEEIVDHSLDIIKQDELPCPRAAVRHASARLATAIAVLTMAGKCNAKKTVAALPAIMHRMVEEVIIHVNTRFEEGERGAAAGWRKAPLLN